MMIVRYYLFVSSILISTAYSAQIPLIDNSEQSSSVRKIETIPIGKNLLLLNIEKICMIEAKLISQMYVDINKEFGIVPDVHEDEWYEAMVQELYNCFDSYILPEDKDRCRSEKKSIDLVKRMIGATLGVEEVLNNSLAMRAEREKFDRRNFRNSLILWVLQGTFCVYCAYQMYKQYQEKKNDSKTCKSV